MNSRSERTDPPRPGDDEPAAGVPARSAPARAVESLLDSARFRRLWVSNLFFFGGVWSQTLILGWLVFELTQSGLLLAIFSAVRMCPLLLGPLSGMLADRYEKVRFILIATIAACIAVVLLAILVTAGAASYPAILAGGLLIGLAQSPTQPARAALTVDFVRRRQLSNANALTAMAMNMTQVVGPGLGGVLIGVFGPAVALWISAAWYLISAGTLLSLRTTQAVHSATTQAGAEPVRSMLVGGIRMVLINRLAAAVLLVTLAANILLWPVFQAFMPQFAEEVLSFDATRLGLLLTCAGAGGLIGSIVIAWLGDFRFKGALFLFGTVAWGGCWVAFALSRSPTLSFLLMAGVGLASAAFGVLQTTLMLMLTEPRMHGRALGMQELAIGIQPIATVGQGFLVETIGLPRTVQAVGLALMAIVLAIAAANPRLVRYS